jgi:methylated-DNA-[protein]-cysteine S-methyltransferase
LRCKLVSIDYSLPLYVISASGIGGFAGSDLDAGFHVGVKRWLLQHEGASW